MKAGESSRQKAAVVEALAKAREKTEEAIHDLANEADKARLLRRTCINTGGVWSFSENGCVEE